MDNTKHTLLYMQKLEIFIPRKIRLLQRFLNVRLIQTNLCKEFVIFFQLKKPHFINHILVFFHYNFFHFHELIHGPQVTSMGIIWLIFVNVYKDFKTLYAKVKTPKVHANTCNIENSFVLNLTTNNPHNLLDYKANI